MVWSREKNSFINDNQPWTQTQYRMTTLYCVATSNGCWVNEFRHGNISSRFHVGMATIMADKNHCRRQPAANGFTKIFRSFFFQNKDVNRKWATPFPTSKIITMSAVSLVLSVPPHNAETISRIADNQFYLRLHAHSIDIGLHSRQQPIPFHRKKVRPPRQNGWTQREKKSNMNWTLNDNNNNN